MGDIVDEGATREWMRRITGADTLLDSTIVRAQACAAGAKKAPPPPKRWGARGGFSTKIHALIDALGYPLTLVLSGGQAADIAHAQALVPETPVAALVADKGYDADWFVAQLIAQGTQVVIPPRANRKSLRDYDRHTYKERHLIECFFGKLKHYRRSCSRFEKTARNYMSFLPVVATLVWLR